MSKQRLLDMYSAFYPHEAGKTDEEKMQILQTMANDMGYELPQEYSIPNLYEEREDVGDDFQNN